MAIVKFMTTAEMDKVTVDELNSLRAIRIETVKCLLSDLSSTLDELVNLGSISRDQITEEFRSDLQTILENKLEVLSERSHYDFYFDDEVSLFTEIELNAIDDKNK